MIKEADQITAGALGPVMMGLMGTTFGLTGSVAAACAASLTAGAASLASQAAVSLISNQGDLGSVTQRPPRYMGKPAHIKISIYNDKCSIIQLSKG